MKSDAERIEEETRLGQYRNDGGAAEAPNLTFERGKGVSTWKHAVGVK